VPGGGYQIRIRGNRSLVQNNTTSPTTSVNDADQANQPLLVVDGIPTTATLMTFSPNDIASLEILKDASATAI